MSKRTRTPNPMATQIKADAAPLRRGLQQAAEAVQEFSESIGLQEDVETPAARSEDDPVAAQSESTEPTIKKTGRPVGRQTEERPLAIFLPPRCPACSSTRREAFRDGPVADDRIHIEIDGQQFNRELWRNTTCLDCGQRYRVIEYRFEPE